MPFTLAHPAAAVPFRRWGLPTSVLAIGSMAPDFPYFMRVPRDTHYGHGWEGFFLYSIPATLVAAAVYHGLLKGPILSLLPASHRAHWVPEARALRVRGMGDALRILLAAIVGSGSHIVWDSFTHFYGWPVQHFTPLRAPLFESPIGTIYLCKLLQYLSFPLGVALMAIWYRNWYRETPPSDEHLRVELSAPALRRLFAAAIGFAALVGIVTAIVDFPADRSQGWAQNTLRVFVVSGGAALAVSLFGYSLWWAWKAKGPTS